MNRTNQTKLQQLHDRLSLRDGRGIVHTSDLRDLLAALLSEEQPKEQRAEGVRDAFTSVCSTLEALPHEARVRVMNAASICVIEPASSGPAKGRTEAELLDGIAQLSVDLAKSHARSAELDRGAQSKGRECFVTVSSREHSAIYEVFEERKDAEVKARMFELRVVRAILDEPAKGGTET